MPHQNKVCQRCGKEMVGEAGIPALSYSIETGLFYTALCHANCSLFGKKPEHYRWLGWAIGMKSSWRWVPNEPRLNAVNRVFRLRLSKKLTVYVRPYYREDTRQSLILDASGAVWQPSGTSWSFTDLHASKPLIDAFLDFSV